MKKLVVALLVFLFGSLGWGTTASAQQDRRVADPVQKENGPPPDASETLATVNGEKITRGEVDLLIAQVVSISMNPKTFEKMDENQRQALMRQMLDRLIENRLILQEAVRQGIQVSDLEADRFLEDFRRQFHSEKEMEEALKKGGTSIEQRKKSDRELMMRLKLEAKMKEQVPISENDIEKYWKETRPSLLKDMVKARHILVKTENEAEEIRKKLQKGERFEDLAKQYSQDTFTKERGGDLGWFSREMEVKEFGEAAFSLKVGEVSPPVKTVLGYHLVLVEGKKGKDDQTLEDHREFIRHNLQALQWATPKRKEWVDSLKAKAKIWNKLAAAP